MKERLSETDSKVFWKKHIKYQRWEYSPIKYIEDDIKRIDLKLGGPVSSGMDFKINRQKIRMLHAGRSPRSRSKLKIFGSKQFISVRKIEVPETFNDISHVSREKVFESGI